MNSKELKFEADPGKGKVSAILLNPRGAKFLLVLGHGAGAGMRHTNMEQIATTLYQRKIATFRYQFPYMERGGGRDSESVTLNTIANAVKTARSLQPRRKIIAGGHSFGGRMTSIAAARGMLDHCTGFVFFAFPLHAVGRPSAHRAEHLPDIQQPVLIFSGTRDQMMSRDLFAPVLKKMGKRATMHSLDTANHGYKILKKTRESKEDVFEEMARVTEEWTRRQIR